MAPRKSSRQSGRGIEHVTAPTIRQVLVHLHSFKFFGEKVSFGFFTRTSDQLTEYKNMQEKCE